LGRLNGSGTQSMLGAAWGTLERREPPDYGGDHGRTRVVACGRGWSPSLDYIRKSDDTCKVTGYGK
jgi:hypothetical protein